ncbi:MAG: hypothetical protein LBP38_03095, partial [Desulfovibrio sp.]|nr:hypothetical protein [Desulfovibrio sp.]
MRIVLDLQNIQGPSKLRGIGRNAFALAQAMISIATEDEFYIILNKQFPEHIEQIRYDFRSIIPQSNIKIFDVPLGCTFNEGNYARIAAAELLRENFILNLKPDIIHIGSGLLESGPSIPGICSVGKLSSTKITVAATLHDFIPMTDPFLYLPDNNCKSLYKQRLDYISKTDLI